jgi:Fe-S-cluster containining protein
MLPRQELRDRDLVQIIDAAAAEAARRGGEWVVCRPGCTSCCLGPFAITALDALRLQRGCEALALMDAPRAARVRKRATQYAAAITPLYPGDSATGALHDDDGLPDEWDNEPCPALDLHSGLCDLYEWRPVTCRVFGPAMLMEGGAIGTCELCYRGASDEMIADGAVQADPGGVERALLAEINLPATIVAFALIDSRRPFE